MLLVTLTRTSATSVERSLPATNVDVSSALVLTFTSASCSAIVRIPYTSHCYSYKIVMQPRQSPVPQRQLSLTTIFPSGVPPFFQSVRHFLHCLRQFQCLIMVSERLLAFNSVFDRLPISNGAPPMIFIV